MNLWALPLLFRQIFSSFAVFFIHNDAHLSISSNTKQQQSSTAFAFNMYNHIKKNIVKAIMHFRGVNLTPLLLCMHVARPFVLQKKPIPESFWRTSLLTSFLFQQNLKNWETFLALPFLTSDADAFLDSLGQKDFIGKSKACLHFMMFALLNCLLFMQIYLWCLLSMKNILKWERLGFTFKNEGVFKKVFGIFEMCMGRVGPYSFPYGSELRVI